MFKNKPGFISGENIIYFSLLAVFLVGFLSFETEFRGPDMPIYYAYTRSIVEDRDLNPVNYIEKVYPYIFHDGTYGVSPTFNLPTQHNHGGTVLWAPFYVYASTLKFLDTKLRIDFFSSYTTEELTKCVLSFSSLIFGIISLILSFIIVRSFFSDFVAFFASIAVFFGTPVFLFAFKETGNANIIALLFMVLSIWYFRHVTAAEKEHWFMFGIFFGIAMVVKVDVWFLPFFIGLIFLWLLYQKRADWQKGVFFLLGVLPPIVFKTINDYIKYGRLYMGEFGVINFQDSYFIEQMFSRYRGFFYFSPILYLCMLGVLVAAWNLIRKNRDGLGNKNRDLVILFFATFMMVKMTVTSLRFSWGLGTPGPRVLVTEFTVFVILLALLISYFKSKRVKTALILVSVICVLWNLMVTVEYITGIDYEYLVNPWPISLRIAHLRYLSRIFSAKDLDIKLRLTLPLFMVFGYLFYLLIFRIKKAEFDCWGIKDLNSDKSLRIFTYLTLFLFASYTLFTVLNVNNNRRNVEAFLEKGYLGNELQHYMLKPDEYAKAENLTSMIEIIYVFDLMGKYELVERKEKLIQDMYGEWGMDFYRDYYEQFVEYKSYRREKGIEKFEYLRGNKRNLFKTLAVFRSVFSGRKLEYYAGAVEAWAGYNLYRILGERSFEQGDYYKASGYFSSAAKIPPGREDAYLRLADTYLRAGDPEKAVEVLKEVLEISPEYIYAYTRLGNIFFEKGSFKEAKKYFKEAVDIDPEYADGYINLAYSYAELGDFKRAIENFKRTIELNPPFVADAYLNLGRVYYGLDDKENLLKQAEKLKSMGKKNMAEKLKELVKEAK